jgi:hypothetical protein
MKSTRRFSGRAVLAAVLATAATAQQRVTLEGVALLGRRAAPWSGASVTALGRLAPTFDAGTGTTEILEATSGADGTFQLRIRPELGYTLWAHGEIEHDGEGPTGRSYPVSDFVVDVGAGQFVELVATGRAVPAEVEVVGLEDWIGHGGLQVRYEPFTVGTVGIPLRPAVDGRFALPLAPPGDGRLLSWTADGAPVLQCWVSVRTAGDPRAGREQRAIAGLPRSWTIRVTEDGTPVAGARVSLSVLARPIEHRFGKRYGSVLGVAQPTDTAGETQVVLPARLDWDWGPGDICAMAATSDGRFGTTRSDPARPGARNARRWPATPDFDEPSATARVRVGPSRIRVRLSATPVQALPHWPVWHCRWPGHPMTLETDGHGGLHLPGVELLSERIGLLLTDPIRTALGSEGRLLQPILMLDLHPEELGDGPGDIVLSELPLLRIRVTGVDGRPAAGVSGIVADPEHGLGNPLPWMVRADPDGIVLLRARPGSHIVAFATDRALGHAVVLATTGAARAEVQLSPLAEVRGRVVTADGQLTGIRIVPSIVRPEENGSAVILQDLAHALTSVSALSADGRFAVLFPTDPRIELRLRAQRTATGEESEMVVPIPGEPVEIHLL